MLTVKGVPKDIFIVWDREEDFRLKLIYGDEEVHTPVKYMKRVKGAPYVYKLTFLPERSGEAMVTIYSGDNLIDASNVRVMPMMMSKLLSWAMDKVGRFNDGP